jgi:hypothetical protein
MSIDDVTILYTSVVLSFLLMSVRWLQEVKEELPPASMTRFQHMIRVLLAAPPVIMLIVAGLILFVWRSMPQVRLVHGLLVLGFWMSATLTLYVFMVLARLKRVLLLVVVGFLMSLAAAVYLTSIDRFNAFFASSLLLYPLVAGLVLILGVYAAIWMLSER